MGKAKYFAPKASSVDLHTDKDDNGIKVEGREILYKRINAYRDIHTCVLYTVVIFKNGTPQRVDLYGCQKAKE